jgi:hypothetical protein
MRRWHSDAKPTAICAKSRDRNFEGLTPTFSPPRVAPRRCIERQTTEQCRRHRQCCNALLTQSYKVSVSVALLLAVFGSSTPAGGSYGCCVRNRTGRGGTDHAGSFVGDRARRWHSNGITDIATATCSEAGSAAALSGGVEARCRDQPPPSPS